MSLVPHAGRLATVALLLRLLRQLPDLLILPFVGYALAVRKLWRDVCHGGSPEGARVGINPLLEYAVLTSLTRGSNSPQCIFYFQRVYKVGHN